MVNIKYINLYAHLIILYINSYACKRETMNQCWYNVGILLAHGWSNIGQRIVFAEMEYWEKSVCEVNPLPA